MSYLDILGIDPAAQKRIVDEARKTSRLVPQVTTAETLHSFRELRYAFADTGHAIESMVDMAKFSTALSAVVADKSQAEQLRRQVYETVKSAELKNKINSPGEFRGFLDQILRAAHASGGVVNPASIFQAYKYSRGALHGYDKEFTSLFLPEIVQEMQTGRGGGSRGGGGTSLAAFKRMFVDQTFALKYVPELLKAGLIDPDKVQYGRGGKVSGLSPGAFYGQDVATKNPFRYMEQFILPALKKKGVNLDDHAAIVQAVAGLGGTEIAKQLLQLMVIQREQMKKRAEMTQQVMGVEGTYQRTLQLYNTSLKAMHKQFTDMAAAVLGPFLPTVTGLQNALTAAAQSVKSLAQTFEKPLEAVAPGLMLGGALGTALLLRRMLAGMGGRVLLGAGMGALLGGGVPGAAVGAGLAAAIGKVGTAATTAAEPVFTFARGIAALANPLTAAVGLLVSAGLLRKHTSLLDPDPSGGQQGDKRYNDALRRKFNEERAAAGLPLLPDLVPLPRSRPSDAPQVAPGTPLPRERPDLGDRTSIPDAESKGAEAGKALVDAVAQAMSNESAAVGAAAQALAKKLTDAINAALGSIKPPGGLGYYGTHDGAGTY